MASKPPEPPEVPMEEPTYKPQEIEPIPGDFDFPSPQIETPPVPEIQPQL